MPKINGNTIKPGNVLQHDGGLWVTVKAEHVKPGKGGAFAMVELKNLIDGRKLNERFRSDDKVERITLEQSDYTFLYAEGDNLVFMDTTTYEQIELNKDWVGEDQVASFRTACRHRRELRGPQHRHQPPRPGGARGHGDRAHGEGPDRSSSYKPAKASNGMRVMIPPFMGPASASWWTPRPASTCGERTERA
jgi:elongation factor P